MLISDKGTAFMSLVIKEMAGVLGITLKHAATKHAQKIGLLERSHASIKQALKIETGKRRSLWRKYVNIAVKLTPKDDKAVYYQSLPMPIHLKEDLIVELALMNKYGIIMGNASFLVRKSHICTKEAQRKITCPCGSQENQQSDCG